MKKDEFSVLKLKIACFHLSWQAQGFFNKFTLPFFYNTGTLKRCFWTVHFICKITKLSNMP